MSRQLFTRRSVLGAAGLGVAGLGAAMSPFANRSNASPGGGAALDPGCYSCSGPAPAYLRSYRQSASIPTPREQTLVIAQPPTVVFDSFNPYIPNGMAGSYGLDQVCFEHLFYFNFETGELINGIGTGWEYNADYTELVLRLNPNARWSDGTPLTADDIVFTVAMLQGNASLFTASGVINNVESATAIDPQTVQYRLLRANPRYHYAFIAGIIGAGFLVQPKHIWENQDPASFPNNPPVHAGPYVLDQVLPDQFMYIWRKNHDYWNIANLNCQPEYVIVRQEQPVDLEVQEFQRGNLDTGGPLTIDYLNQQVIKATDESAILFPFSDPCPRSLFPNFDGPSGLMAIPEGRWAVSYMIDRQVAAEVLSQPPSQPAKFPWAPYVSNEQWSVPEIQQQHDFTFDMNRAAELLDAAGATLVDGRRQLNGQPLNVQIITPVVVTDPGYQIADMLRLNAAELGLEMTLSSLQGGTHGDVHAFGDYDINAQWMCGLVFDPVQMYDDFLMRDYVPVGERAISNLNRVQLPEFDEVVTRLEAADPADPANKPDFDRALELYFEGLPVIPTAQTAFSFLYNTKTWTGWPTPEDRYGIGASWWSQFRFVIGRLQPAAAAQ
ncbi:MAG TPA: ABC transporter substrate-binding protein [Thermomicrobiales bacterium]|jgi:peptide/nickel transport system substrate-binding protein|nr:ABC transporter substrate-binding protein [Thermomicrobiales bacterium]